MLRSLVALAAMLAFTGGATADVSPPPTDALPAISIDDATTQETNVDTGVTLQLTLSAPSDDPVTVAYATADGTADATDYVPTSGTVTFAPRETSARVVVEIKGDALDEPDETFYVDLSGAKFATIARARGTVTVVDDDPRPIRLLDASVDARWGVHRTYTRVLRFAVHAQAKAVVRVRCFGGGCRKRLAGAKLRPGALVDVRVTSLTAIGRLFEYRIRAARQPRLRELCLPPGRRPSISC